MTTYAGPPGDLPPQTTLHTGRAVFTESYAVIPRGCMSDIVTSYFPGWGKTRFWVIARPLSGFAESFSQYILDIPRGGGSDTPETEPGAQSVLFVTEVRPVHYGDTREKARCKARFVRVSVTLHEMRASCATPSGRVDQIATLNRVGDNHYAGSFQNTQYSVTGSIQATVRGNSLSVRLKGDGGGSGSFNLSRN